MPRANPCSAGLLHPKVGPLDAGKLGQRARAESGERRALAPLPVMSAKAVRLSHQLLSRVVRARKVLFWDVVETSVALGHTSEALEQLGKAVEE